MQYLKPSFSLSMPGANARWPFKPKSGCATLDASAKLRDGRLDLDSLKLILKDDNLRSCPACGAVDRPGETHIAAGHTDRPRKKVCFGLKSTS